MTKHSTWMVLSLCLGQVMESGCSRHNPLPAAPAQVMREHHRPPWLRGLASDVDVMAQCLDGREAPAYVLLVYHDPSRITAVTTVDAFRALEHCVVDAGRVVDRRPSSENLGDFPGLPLFSLGAERPSVARGQPLEEVVSEGRILGWLHWPDTNAQSAGDEDELDVPNT